MEGGQVCHEHGGKWLRTAGKTAAGTSREVYSCGAAGCTSEVSKCQHCGLLHPGRDDRDYLAILNKCRRTIQPFPPLCPCARCRGNVGCRGVRVACGVRLLLGLHAPRSPTHPLTLPSFSLSPPSPPPFHPPVVRHRQSSPHRPQHLLRNVGRAPLVSAADQFCTDQAARLSAPAQRTCQFIPAPTLYATSMPSPSVPIGTALVRT